MDPRERKNKITGAREDEGAEKRTTYFLQGVHRRHSWGGKGWQSRRATAPDGSLRSISQVTGCHI